jgi:hypothetical protein
MNFDISFVVQGPIFESTKKLCSQIRLYYPDVFLIIVTWKGQNVDSLFYDKLVELDDPGADPILFNGEVINYENTRRQYLSTRAGFYACETQFVLKIRSDFELFRRVDLLSLSKKLGNRILVSNINTIDPLSNLAYIGHISDWIYFANTATLRSAFKKENVLDDYFVSHGSVNKNEFKFGSFTAEQIMLKNFFDDFNYFDGSKFSSSNKFTRLKYLFFLCKHFEICNLKELGFMFKKYQRFYQFDLRNWKAFVGFWLVTISPYVFKLYRKKLLSRDINYFEDNILFLKIYFSKFVVK